MKRDSSDEGPGSLNRKLRCSALNAVASWKCNDSDTRVHRVRAYGSILIRAWRRRQESACATRSITRVLHVRSKRRLMRVTREQACRDVFVTGARATAWSMSSAAGPRDETKFIFRLAYVNHFISVDRMPARTARSRELNGHLQRRTISFPRQRRRSTLCSRASFVSDTRSPFLVVRAER